MAEQNPTHPEQLLQINSLRRAGQHLLVEYLGGCLTATQITWAHSNDVDNNLRKGHPDRKEWTAESALAKGAGRHTLITNYEDYSYAQRQNSPVYAGLQDTGIASRDIVLVRDFPNLAATRIARMADAEQNGKPHTFDVFSLWHARDIWIEHAQLALAPTEDATVVLYNRLIDRQDIAYREKLAASLGLVNSDSGLDRVPGFGGGSSIDGRRFDGRPQAMNVLKRWLDLQPKHYDWLLGVINDPDIDKLNQQLFGFGVAEVAAELAIMAYSRQDTIA